jgi:2-methylcitrate dehydratase PrpD
MMAQYSIPFCIALSLYSDPTDPESFNQRQLKNKDILRTMREVQLQVDREIEQRGWDRAARVTVALNNKKRHSALVIHFKGTPDNPLSRSEVENKAHKLTAVVLPPGRLARLIETVDNLDKVTDVSRLGALLKL